MGSEAGPSGVHPTDEKGKRKRPESPAQDLTSKKVSLKVRGVAAVREPHIHPEKQEEDHLLDYVDTCPKGISSQYPNPVNIGEKSPWPIEASAVNYPTFDDLGNFKKFVRDSRDEAELAVYLGLQHKHDLRQFAFSWPVIKAWIRAPHNQTISLKSEINHLIKGGKELSCIEDPYQVWPQLPEESEEDASLRITHIMAWHLVQMSKDIEEYTMSSDLHNFHRTRRYRGELSAMLELDIPLDNIFHPRPQLIS
ncbi:uncharacterized protein N7518_000757 [Penicillium psychrosexuale]|uniref:uncharacterized protein n=1 Tax=Penicillium psychrosexuale TaxID=1002107 RepID=UPI002545946B|nr:uncharacterized protein N7518_000757 [Penicillium psychrosexuale]KAJ5804454.1 hypothetical protein N7518_000757 [Penicillium psychrosexuale]